MADFLTGTDLTLEDILNALNQLTMEGNEGTGTDDRPYSITTTPNNSPDNTPLRVLVQRAIDNPEQLDATDKKILGDLVNLQMNGTI